MVDRVDNDSLIVTSILREMSVFRIKIMKCKIPLLYLPYLKGVLFGF